MLWIKEGLYFSRSRCFLKIKIRPNGLRLKSLIFGIKCDFFLIKGAFSLSRLIFRGRQAFKDFGGAFCQGAFYGRSLLKISAFLRFRSRFFHELFLIKKTFYFSALLTFVALFIFSINTSQNTIKFKTPTPTPF